MKKRATIFVFQFEFKYFFLVQIYNYECKTKQTGAATTEPCVTYLVLSTKKTIKKANDFDSLIDLTINEEVCILNNYHVPQINTNHG